MNHLEALAKKATKEKLSLIGKFPTNQNYLEVHDARELPQYKKYAGIE